MADGWWERLLRFVGFEEIEEIEEPPSELEAERAEEAYAGGYTSRRQRRAATTSGNGRPMDDRRLAGDNVNVRKGSLVSLPASDGRFRLVVVRPLKFDEVEYIAKHIKDRSPVILNLEDIETEEAQKLVNFLSGAIYALDGEMQRIGSHILLFTPLNVEVSIEDLREELKELP